MNREKQNFCHFGPFFATNKPKNQNFQKNNKKKGTPGYIIILHKRNQKS